MRGAPEPSQLTDLWAAFPEALQSCAVGSTSLLCTCVFPYNLSSVQGVIRRLEKLSLEGACATQKSLEGKTHHDTAKIPLSLPDPYMLLAVTPSGDRHLLNENMGAFELL